MLRSPACVLSVHQLAMERQSSPPSPHIPSCVTLCTVHIAFAYQREPLQKATDQIVAAQKSDVTELLHHLSAQPDDRLAPWSQVIESLRPSDEYLHLGRGPCAVTVEACAMHA